MLKEYSYAGNHLLWMAVIMYEILYSQLVVIDGEYSPNKYA